MARGWSLPQHTALLPVAVTVSLTHLFLQAPPPCVLPQMVQTLMFVSFYPLTLHFETEYPAGAQVASNSP